MKLGLALAVLLTLAINAFAGILPTSRGGTGANLTPSSGKVVTSSSSALQLSTSIVLPAGGTVVIPAGGTTASSAPLYVIAGSTLSTKEKGAIESNGTNLFWTNSSGVRNVIQISPQNN
jgi:hypothetical protein